VLFQYSEPGHSVAVFRGAQLRQAIAAGLVPGFGNLGSRAGKKIDTSADDMAAASAMAAADARAAAAAMAAAAADAMAAANDKAAADARAATNARNRAAAAMAAADARAAANARARAASVKAAADARAAPARPSGLELAEQACVQACKNLAGQCRNPFM